MKRTSATSSKHDQQREHHDQYSAVGDEDPAEVKAGRAQDDRVGAGCRTAKGFDHLQHRCAEAGREERMSGNLDGQHLLAKSGYQADGLLQDDGGPDGRDERRQAARLAQRTVGKPLHQHPGETGPEHACQKGDDDSQHRLVFEHASCLQAAEGEQPTVGAYHEDVAVGKIDHGKHSVDHGVTQGDQCVKAAHGKTVDQLFQKCLKRRG